MFFSVYYTFGIIQIALVVEEMICFKKKKKIKVCI